MFRWSRIPLSLPLTLLLTLLVSQLIAFSVTAAPLQDSDETLREQEVAVTAQRNGPAVPNDLTLATESLILPLFMGVDDTTVPAYTVDPRSNLMQPAFSGFQIWGAAYDPVNRKVYFNNGINLYEWPLAGTPTLLGTMVDGGGNNQSMVGLAFHDGQLYATKNIANEAVWLVNTTTLVATVYIDYVDGDYDFGGFAIDPRTGIMYGTNDDTTPHGSGLFQINQDGSATLIAPYPAGQTDIDGLAIGDDGRAYLLTDEPGFTYVYNLITGAYEAPLQNPWTAAEVFVGGTYITTGAPIAVCGAPQLAIPDNVPTGTFNTLTYNGNLTLTDVNVWLDISHTWVGDLNISLEHTNSGTQINLVNRPGVPASAFGCSGNNVNATIDDEGADGNVEATCLASDPAIAGSLVGGDPPDSALLAAFDGENLAGSWTLTISDNAGGDTGTLNAWCLLVDGGLPEIEVHPSALSSYQPQDTQVAHQLQISNTGAFPLDWSVAEAPAASSFTYQDAPPYAESIHPPSIGPVPSGVDIPAAPSPGSHLTPSAPHQVEQLDPAVRSWNSQHGEYFTTFDLDTPENLPYIAPFPGAGNFIGAGEYIDGLSYMVDSANNVFVVDDRGTILDQYLATDPPGTEQYSGMALHPTTNEVYASSTNVSTSSLLTFDPHTGSAALIGPITNSPANLALSFDGAGNLFGYDLVNDMFMQIDPATANTSNAVALPFDANFGQGMFYDPASGLVQMLAFNGGAFRAELWTVDTTDPTAPAFNFVGPLGDTYPGGLNQLTWGGADNCNPTAIPWASVSSDSGATAPGASSTLDVTFDANGLAMGTYNGILCLHTNDPYQPLVRVPLTLTVGPPATILLEKTVGLDPTGCAADDTLDTIGGARGVPVTYCYTVHNTGPYTLTTHSLVDNRIGDLLIDFAHVLAPGATTFFTTTTRLTGDTVNTATWTAVGNGNISAADRDSAFVTVDFRSSMPFFVKSPPPAAPIHKP